MITMKNKVMIFQVSTVLETLEKNLQIHEKEYDELVKANTAHLQTELEKALEQTRQDGKFPDLSKVHEAERAKPKNYSTEYKKVISMLKLTTQKELELTVDEFDCYMNDNWDWKNTFLSNKTLYGMM